MNPHNIDILKSIFNWHVLEEITENEILEMSKKIKYPIGDRFYLKGTWSYFKKYTIFSLEQEPLLFLKFVRLKYFQEILGLHMTRYFFDSELGFKQYVTGVYQKRKSKAIPYIATSYEQGEHIGKYDITKYHFYLGRQCYLHEILCLYDVFDRHFIVRGDNSLCRIDFGRCFENLHRKYLGFSDYLKHKKLNLHNKEFQKGYQFEIELVRDNLRRKKRELINIFRKIKELEYDKVIIFNTERFANRLIDHWSRIGFLRDANIEDIQWV